MAGQEVEEDESGGTSSIPSEKTVPVPDVSEARAFLVKARRPLIVAGVGVEPEKPYDAIRRLAEAAQAPVIVTPKAKGAISDAHPLSVGTFGLTQTDPPYEIADESDCLVAVGFDVVEMERLWDQPQPIIWVAPWANEDPQLSTVKYELVGPMIPTLDQLADANFAPDSDWGQMRVAAFRKAQARVTLPEPVAGHLLPQTVLDILRHNIPDQTIVTTDVGSHKIFAGLTWPTYAPNSYLLSNGLSSMGFGLPAAIAAARVSQQTVVCITGDGGMAMVMGELGLLRDLNLPVIIVMMNDNALDLIRSAQIRRGKPVYGTEFVNPDYEAIARGFNIDFYRVSNKAACTEATREAFENGRPAIVEALIDPIGYPTTPRNVS